MERNKKPSSDASLCNRRIFDPESASRLIHDPNCNLPGKKSETKRAQTESRIRKDLKGLHRVLLYVNYCGSYRDCRTKQNENLQCF